jgi:hypothetical protein
MTTNWLRTTINTLSGFITRGMSSFLNHFTDLRQIGSVDGAFIPKTIENSDRDSTHRIGEKKGKESDLKEEGKGERNWVQVLKQKGTEERDTLNYGGKEKK